jgi:integrase
MSVRKRTWTTARGEVHTAWVACYADSGGVQRLKTFARKRDADAFHSTAKVEVEKGAHVPDSQSITVERAAEAWIANGVAEGLETTTIDQRNQHVNIHILPELGRLKLTKVSVGTVRGFRNKLREKGNSEAMVKRIMVSLGSIFGDAVETGKASRNPVRDLKSRKRNGTERHQRRLETGVDIPLPGEIKAVLKAATGRWRPFLMTAALTGLRASELRGLRWQDVDLDKGTLSVSQRADRYKEIGSPKSAAARRTVSLVPELVRALREWKLKCPKKDGRLWLVFPTGAGNIEDHTNIITRGWWPVQVAAGVVKPVLDAEGRPARDEDGQPLIEAKYPGLHSLRHFFASWCLGPVKDGGRELQPKRVQVLMGHSSINVTLDLYAHLLPVVDEGAELRAAGRALLG